MASVLSAAHFHSEEAAYAFIEGRIWASGRVCPHCGVIDKSGPLKGKSTRTGVYKCYACRKPFTVKIGTVFESSHIKLHIWLQAMHLLASSKKGISANQLSRILAVSLQSAWFLSHRIREAMKDIRFDDAGPLGGIGKFVEADETYIGGKEKNKHRSRRTSAVGGKGKQIVFSLVERGGKVRSMHLLEVNAATLGPIMAAQIDRRTFLMTDEAGQYRFVGRDFAGHAAVSHGIEEYVRGNAHTNTAENFFSILKRGITGCYFHVSQEHLHRYLAEFDFRYSHRSRLGVDDVERTDRIIKGVVGKRLTYKTARGQKGAATLVG
jgi:transposase-like protein